MNTNKLMRMEFRRATFHIKGFTKEVFIKLLEALPTGTEILGWGEITYRDTYQILIAHESFTELKQAEEIPLLDCIVTKNVSPDNSFSYEVQLLWPEEYKANHECQYKTYQGFSKTEDVCTICGKVK